MLTPVFKKTVSRFFIIIGSAVLTRKVAELSPILVNIIHLVDNNKCIQFLYPTPP